MTTDVADGAQHADAASQRAKRMCNKGGEVGGGSAPLTGVHTTPTGSAAVAQLCSSMPNGQSDEDDGASACQAGAKVDLDGQVHGRIGRDHDSLQPQHRSSIIAGLNQQQHTHQATGRNVDMSTEIAVVGRAVQAAEAERLLWPNNADALFTERQLQQLQLQLLQQQVRQQEEQLQQQRLEQQQAQILSAARALPPSAVASLITTLVATLQAATVPGGGSMPGGSGNQFQEQHFGHAQQHAELHQPQQQSPTAEQFSTLSQAEPRSRLQQTSSETHGSATRLQASIAPAWGSMGTHPPVFTSKSSFEPAAKLSGERDAVDADSDLKSNRSNMGSKIETSEPNSWRPSSSPQTRSSAALLADAAALGAANMPAEPKERSPEQSKEHRKSACRDAAATVMAAPPSRKRKSVSPPATASAVARPAVGANPEEAAAEGLLTLVRASKAANDMSAAKAADGSDRDTERQQESQQQQQPHAQALSTVLPEAVAKAALAAAEACMTGRSSAAEEAASIQALLAMAANAALHRGSSDTSSADHAGLSGLLAPGGSSMNNSRYSSVANADLTLSGVLSAQAPALARPMQMLDHPIPSSALQGFPVVPARSPSRSPRRSIERQPSGSQPPSPARALTSGGSGNCGGAGNSSGAAQVHRGKAAGGKGDGHGSKSSTGRVRCLQFAPNIGKTRCQALQLVHGQHLLVRVQIDMVMQPGPGYKCVLSSQAGNSGRLRVNGLPVSALGLRSVLAWEHDVTAPPAPMPGNSTGPNSSAPITRILLVGSRLDRAELSENASAAYEAQVLEPPLAGNRRHQPTSGGSRLAAHSADPARGGSGSDGGYVPQYDSWGGARGSAREHVQHSRSMLDMGAGFGLDGLAQMGMGGSSGMLNAHLPTDLSIYGLGASGGASGISQSSSPGSNKRHRLHQQHSLADGGSQVPAGLSSLDGLLSGNQRLHGSSIDMTSRPPMYQRGNPDVDSYLRTSNLSNNLLGRGQDDRGGGYDVPYSHSAAGGGQGGSFTAPALGAWEGPSGSSPLPRVGNKRVKPEAEGCGRLGELSMANNGSLGHGLGGSLGSLIGGGSLRSQSLSLDQWQPQFRKQAQAQQSVQQLAQQQAQLQQQLQLARQQTELEAQALFEQQQAVNNSAPLLRNLLAGGGAGQQSNLGGLLQAYGGQGLLERGGMAGGGGLNQDYQPLLDSAVSGGSTAGELIALLRRMQEDARRSH